jgi:23S rRNA (uracil1939-C5)-methyltransferase
MIRAGDELVVAPGQAVAGGWMLARHDGQVILVSGAIPGERARIRVGRATRDVAYAHLLEALEPSPDRRAPSVRWPCGGNAYAHIAYARQLELKIDVVLDALRRIGRIEVDSRPAIAPSTERGYRMRARFHAGSTGFGFYREGTRLLCDPAESGQLLDQSVDVVRGLSDVLRTDGLDDVSALELAENCDATGRAVYIEARALQPATLRRLSVPGVTGVSGTRMGDPGTILVHGDPYVSDDLEVDAGDGRVATARLRRTARSFFQGNRFLLATLVNRVVRWAAAERVTDLYAGVGLFATALAAAGRACVVAVEGDPVSSADLEANAAPHGAALRAVHAPVEEFLRGPNAVEGGTVIVDPPRTGLSPEARARLAAAKPARLIYVSCDAATLARDLATLLGAGCELAHVEAFDLFPNTAHVEVLAVLESRHGRV